MRQLKINNSITSRNEAALSKYLIEISRYPLLTIDEEIELAQAVHRGGEDGKKAKERLIQCNLRFVVSVAKQYQGQGVSLIDLINEGNIGLLKAADRFDVTRGFKFISYAVWWIRQSIMQALSDQSRVIRLPQNANSALSKIYQAITAFEQENMRKPTTAEISELTSIEESKVDEIMKADFDAVSINKPVTEDGEKTLEDHLESGEESHADSIVDQESLTYDINVVLSKVLSARELQIIKSFYGIDGPAKGLDEIGTDLALTHERVRQIREKSIAKLRDSEYCGKLSKYLG